MDTTGSERAAPRVPSLESFGARLALIRHELRLNTVEIAAMCEVDDQTWRNWEAGARPRDLVALARKIAERTNYDLTWLLLGPTGADPSTRWVSDVAYSSAVAA